MTAARIDRGLRWGGFVIGAAVMIIALLSWRIPGGNGIPGLDLTITVDPTGELQTTPAGPVFFSNGITPGLAHATHGSFVVRNRTGTTLDVRLRALPSSFAVDDILRVEVKAGDVELFSGTLRELRRWTGNPITLISGASRVIAVVAWLPADATSYQGNQDVSLEFLSAPVGA